MTREEFNNYYHLRSVKETCLSCEHSSGYVEWLKCKHPYRDTNEIEIVESTQVCDMYEPKEDGDWNNVIMN